MDEWAVHYRPFWAGPSIKYMKSANRDLSNEPIFRVISHRNQEIQHFVNDLKIEKMDVVLAKIEFLLNYSSSLNTCAIRVKIFDV